MATLVWDDAEVEEAWMSAAERFGMTARVDIWDQEDDGFEVNVFDKKVYRIEVVADGTRVAVESPPAGRDRGGRRTDVRLAGRTSVPGLVLSVRGDTVKGSDEAYARAWVDEATRVWIERAEGYHFEIHEGLVWGSTGGLETSAGVLEAAIRVVVALATRGQRIAAAWQEILEGLGLRTDLEGVDSPGGFRLLLEGAGGRRVLALRFGEVGRGGMARLWTVLGAERRGTARDRFFGVSDELGSKAPRGLRHVRWAAQWASRFFGDDPAALSRRLARLTGEALRACGPAVVASNGGTVELLLPGIVGERDLLRHALEVLEHVREDPHAASPAGPYR